MEITQVKLLKSFETHIIQVWEDYRNTHSLEDTSTEFVEFLIQEKIIQASTIRRFAIQQEFLTQSANHKNKTATVKFLSTKYSVSTRGIWSTIRMLNNQV